MWFRVSRVRAPYPTPLIGGSGITPGPPRLFHFGMSPSGKAQDFDSCIRAFEPRHPSQCGLASPARRSDSVAQQAEQLPFKQWVRGSNPRWVTIKAKQYRCRRPEAYGINCFRAFPPRKFTDDSIDANHCFPLTGGTRTPFYSEVGKIKTMWCPF